MTPKATSKLKAARAGARGGRASKAVAVETGQPGVVVRDASGPSVQRPREFAKSARTRVRILESGVACLVEVGYGRMSTAMVAERAKIARSAMQYHFPTRADFIGGLVRYVHYESSRRYTEAVTASADHGELSALDIYWDHVRQPLFIAYSELHFAARTDEELAAILRPVTAEYERDRIEISRRLYPDVWEKHPDALPLFRDISRFVVEGMAMSPVAEDRKRVEAILEFIKWVRHDLMSHPERFKVRARKTRAP